MTNLKFDFTSQCETDEMSFLGNEWDETFLNNLFRCGGRHGVDLGSEYAMAKKEFEDRSGPGRQDKAQDVHCSEHDQQQSDLEI